MAGLAAREFFADCMLEMKRGRIHLLRSALGRGESRSHRLGKGQFLGQRRGILADRYGNFSAKSLQTHVATRVRSWFHVFREDMNGERTCMVSMSILTHRACV